METENKRILIGHPFEEKPYWWLIHVFAAVSEDKIQNLEDKLFLPSEYKEFLLKVANGSRFAFWNIYDIGIS